MSIEKILAEAVTKILLSFRNENDFFNRVIAVKDNGKTLDIAACYNNIKKELFD